MDGQVLQVRQEVVSIRFKRKGENVNVKNILVQKRWRHGY